MAWNFAKRAKSVCVDGSCYGRTLVASHQLGTGLGASWSKRSSRAGSGFPGILRRANARCPATPQTPPDRSSDANSGPTPKTRPGPGRPRAKAPEIGAHAAARRLQFGHVVKPGFQDAEDIVDGSRHAQRTDVLSQGTVPHLRGIAVHAAKGERLHGLGQSGNAVREPGPQAR